MKVGDGFDDAVDAGPLIDGTALAKVEAHTRHRDQKPSAAGIPAGVRE